MSVHGSREDTQAHHAQNIVNFCARVATDRRRHDHIADAVQQLGWLTTTQLIDFQTVCATHAVVTTRQPESLYSKRANQQHLHKSCGIWLPNTAPFSHGIGVTSPLLPRRQPAEH